MGLLGEYDGQWFDLTALESVLEPVAEPAGHYEVDDAGAVAEVWEVRSRA